MLSSALLCLKNKNDINKTISPCLEMTLEEKFKALKDTLNTIGMMGQWYQRYNITASAEEAYKIIKEIEEKLDEDCGMSRK